MRNLLATLLLSTGVPMLTAGDELGRTQQGNNNAYCQDNEISWLDWKAVDEDLLAFVTRLVALRRSSPVLRQEAFFEGHEIPGTVRTGGTRDLAWFAPDGGQLTDGGLVRHRPADARHVPRRPRHPAPRRARPAAGRRLLPGPAARRRRSR